MAATAGGRYPQGMDAKLKTPMTGRLSAEETARRGDEIYQRDVRPLVEADHHGEFVAIDVESGSWAIAGNLYDARELLDEKQPDALDVWLLRVGHRALHHFGRPSARYTRYTPARSGAHGGR